MAQIKIKGVFIKRGYWFANIAGESKYCGKGQKGYDRAILARKKWDVQKHERQDGKAGLYIQRSKFSTVGDMIDWFLNLASQQKEKSYRWRCERAARSRSAMDRSESLFVGRLPLGECIFSEALFIGCCRWCRQGKHR